MKIYYNKRTHLKCFEWMREEQWVNPPKLVRRDIHPNTHQSKMKFRHLKVKTCFKNMLFFRIVLFLFLEGNPRGHPAIITRLTEMNEMLKLENSFFCERQSTLTFFYEWFKFRIVGLWMMWDRKGEFEMGNRPHCLLL